MKQRDETWLYDETAEVAVPFEMTVRGGEAFIEYYPTAKPLVDEFLQKFGACEAFLLSAEAVKWACERFGAFLEQHGFWMSPDSEDYYIGYALDEPQGQILPEITRLAGDETYTDLTETDIEGLCAGGYIIYAAIVDNNIAAVANTGEPIAEETPREVEIGVDTAEKYRRRGYGKACVTALVRELHERGYTAVYECASENTASVGLAESLGGKAAYRKFYIVGFRDE